MPLAFREAEEEPAEEDGEEEAKKIYKEILEVFIYLHISLCTFCSLWIYSWSCTRTYILLNDSYGFPLAGVSVPEFSRLKA